MPTKPRLTLTWRQHHPKAKPFRKRGFPLYDELGAIVEGTIAIGANVFSIGSAMSVGSLASISSGTGIDGEFVNHEDRGGGQESNCSSDKSDDDEACTRLAAKGFGRCSQWPQPPPTQKTPARRNALAHQTPLSQKRQHRSDARVSGPQALSHLARAIENLAASGEPEAPPGPAPVGLDPALTSSPTRKRQAWLVVMKEEDLSDNELADVPRIFRGRPDIADEYLSFPETKKTARGIWLRRELDKVRELDK
jgi:hypothetical protein